MNFLSLFVLIPLLMLLGLWLVKGQKGVRAVMVVGSSTLLAMAIALTVKFLMDRNDISAETAKDLIEQTDAVRSDYHNFYSESNWGDSRSYDVCINSSLLGIEGSAEFLLSLAKKYLEL